MNNNLMHSEYLFYANPTTFPDWKWEERFAVCMNIETSWYKNRPVWRYKIKRGQYKDYIFEIPKEEAYKVVVRNAIKGSDCPDLIPISAMKSIEPIKI